MKVIIDNCDLETTGDAAPTRVDVTIVDHHSEEIEHWQVLLSFGGHSLTISRRDLARALRAFEEHR